jgi:hypothetical protein
MDPHDGVALRFYLAGRPPFREALSCRLCSRQEPDLDHLSLVLTALLPRNSVGTAQVTNGSLQPNDLSKNARTALKGNTGPRGPAGAQGAQGATGATGATGAQGVQGAPGQPATKLFVALDAGGTLTKNSGATLAARTGTGIYRIAFNTDITNCVYLATAGQDAGGVSGDYNLFTSRTSTTTVNVVIFDGSNNALDLPFYLAVFC